MNMLNRRGDQYKIIIFDDRLKKVEVVESELIINFQFGITGSNPPLKLKYHEGKSS
jgi:hypothetical protein